MRGGWGRGSVAITVGTHPYRKSPCLFVQDRPGVIDTVAYFRSPDEADRFTNALARLLGAEPPEAKGEGL